MAGVARAGSGGTGPRTIVAGQDTPSGVAASGNSLYRATAGAGQAERFFVAVGPR